MMHAWQEMSRTTILSFAAIVLLYLSTARAEEDPPVPLESPHLNATLRQNFFIQRSGSVSFARARISDTEDAVEARPAFLALSWLSGCNNDSVEIYQWNRATRSFFIPVGEGEVSTGMSTRDVECQEGNCGVRSRRRSHRALTDIGKHEQRPEYGTVFQELLACQPYSLLFFELNLDVTPSGGVKSEPILLLAMLEGGECSETPGRCAPSLSVYDYDDTTKTFTVMSTTDVTVRSVMLSHGTIGLEHFLCVAADGDDESDGSFVLHYDRETMEFQQWQSGLGASSSCKFFHTADEAYLLLSRSDMSVDAMLWNPESQVFDGPTERFSSGSDERGRPMLVISTIVTTLYTSDSVSHESEDVLIVANTDSEATAQMSVYKWNEKSSKFRWKQSLSTSAVGDIEMLDVHGFKYLVSLPVQDSTELQLPLWRWDGDKFVSEPPIAVESGHNPKELAFVSIPQLRETTDILLNTTSDTVHQESDFFGIAVAMANEEAEHSEHNSTLLAISGSCINDCSNRGSCDVDSISCACNGKYFGVDCGQDECEVHGSCNTRLGKCDCDPGYEGEACSTRLDLISRASAKDIIGAVRTNTPLVNLEVFAVNGSLLDGPRAYWTLSRQEVMLFRRWTEISVFSFGLLWPSVRFVEVNLARPFTSFVESEQITELGAAIYQILSNENKEGNYRTCHLASDDDDGAPRLECCQDRQLVFRSACEVEVEKGRLYDTAANVVKIIAFCAIITSFLMYVASTPPLFELSDRLSTTTDIPFPVSWDRALGLRMHWPFGIVITIAVSAYLLVRLTVEMSNDPPGVYGYYQQYEESFFDLSFAIGSCVVVFFALLLVGTTWVLGSLLQARKYLRAREMDSRRLKDFGALPDYTDPTIMERRSMLHPEIHASIREYLLSRGYDKLHYTAVLMWLAYMVLWMAPCFVVYVVAHGFSFADAGVVSVLVVAFTLYYISHWVHQMNQVENVTSRLSLSFKLSRKGNWIVDVVLWIAMLLCAASSALLVVEALSAVVLAVSINSFSYTIVTFSITFVVLISDEFRLAREPFEAVKQHLMVTGGEFGMEHFHAIVKQLRLSLLQRYLEGSVRIVIIFGVLVLGFMAVMSASGAATSESFLLLITTLVPVLTAVLSFLRKTSIFEQQLFLREIKTVQARLKVEHIAREHEEDPTVTGDSPDASPIGLVDIE